MPNRPHRIASLVYPNLCTFEFGCVTEVFALARPEYSKPLYEFFACAVGSEDLQACGGITVRAEHGLEMLAKVDTILIPGWHDLLEVPDERLLKALRDACARGARIASICSGVALLAYAGLLDGRRATTHWQYADLLATRFPNIAFDKNVLYIDEGQIITSAGSAAGLDMCLHLVRRDHGEAVANQVARRLVVAPHREGGQAQFVEQPSVDSNVGDRFGALLDRVRSDLSRPYTVRELAEIVNMSERSFVRHFKRRMGTSPARWLIGERISLAKQLLETTDLGFARVASTTGLRTEGNLRHQFRRRVNLTPAQYRKRFRLSAKSSRQTAGRC